MSDETMDRMEAEASNIYDGEGYERDYPIEVKTPSGSSNVVRIVGGSNSFKRYSVSWFMCDDDIIRSFVIENDVQGQGVLARMLGDSDNFYRGGILESKKGQFGKIEVHKAVDPELHKRFTEYWNPAYNGPGSCKPRKEYVYNVIHRNPEDINGQVSNWCQVNNHTKLMKLGPKMFKNLKTVRDNEGEFDVYDILFSKEGTGRETNHTVMKAGLKTEPKVVGNVSAEEAAFGKYDLDEVSELSSATYILKYLKNQIERADAVLKKTHLSELEAQKEIEQAEFQKNQEGAGSDPGSEIPASARVDTPPQTRVASPAPPIAPQANTPAGPQLPAQENPWRPTPPPVGAAPAPAPAPAQEISRVPINAGMVACGHCQQQIAQDVAVCPKCNGTVQAPCDVCKNMFSAFASTCPHCGTNYTAPGATQPTVTPQV